MSDTIKVSCPETRGFWEIPILYEDEQVLALNKPSGLLTSPDRHHPESPDLMQLLHRAIARGVPWARDRQLTYLANTHRLDYETTGVILLAKNKPTLIAVANVFGIGKPCKSYVVLTQGSPNDESFDIELKLAPDSIKPGRFRVDQHRGKNSHTHCQVLERFSGYTLLKCDPAADRAHQVRVHLQTRRLPVVGDSFYGGKPLLLSSLKPHYRLKPNATESPLIAQAALHLAELRIPHPGDGTMVTVTAPWPKYMNVAVKYLRRYASVGSAPAEAPDLS